MFRSQDRRGEFLQASGRMLPHFRWEAHLFRAEPVQQLFPGPAGVARDLWEKTTGAIGDDEKNAVSEKIEVQRMGSRLQWGKQADFDVQPGQVGELYTLGGEPGIVQHTGSGLLNDLRQRSIGIQPTDASAQAMRWLFMQRNETSRRLKQGGIDLLQCR